jgi:nitrite reductase/ring-hydroxylating ferredoxin subunit
MKMNWVLLIQKENLDSEFSKPGKLIKKWVKGKEICLGRTSEGYFAVQNHCPHAGAELNFGFLENNRIICPFHRYSFDTQTGRSLPSQGEALKVYPLEIREDGLYIGIKTLFGS